MCGMRLVFVLKFHGYTSASCRWVRSTSKNLARVVRIALSVSYKPMQYSRPFKICNQPCTSVWSHSHTKATKLTTETRRPMPSQQATQYAGIKYWSPMRPEVQGCLKSIQEERHFIELHFGDWVTHDNADCVKYASEPSTSPGRLSCNLNTPHTLFP